MCQGDSLMNVLIIRPGQTPLCSREVVQNSWCPTCMPCRAQEAVLMPMLDLQIKSCAIHTDFQKKGALSVCQLIAAWSKMLGDASAAAALRQWTDS